MCIKIKAADRLTNLTTVNRLINSWILTLIDNICNSSHMSKVEAFWCTVNEVRWSKLILNIGSCYHCSVPPSQCLSAFIEFKGLHHKTLKFSENFENKNRNGVVWIYRIFCVSIICGLILKFWCAMVLMPVPSEWIKYNLKDVATFRILVLRYLT